MKVTIGTKIRVKNLEGEEADLNNRIGHVVYCYGILPGDTKTRKERFLIALEGEGKTVLPRTHFDIIHP